LRSGRQTTRRCPSRYTTNTHSPASTDRLGSENSHTPLATSITPPGQLYASSLTGQGLSLDVSFVKTLDEQGNVYAKELEAFKKAVKGKDKGKVRFLGAAGSWLGCCGMGWQ
jgi:hypothetical protein